MDTRRVQPVVVVKNIVGQLMREHERQPVIAVSAFDIGAGDLDIMAVGTGIDRIRWPHLEARSAAAFERDMEAIGRAAPLISRSSAPSAA